MADTVDVAKVLRALKFAAYKHRTQRRKGNDFTPYINHPIEIAEMLATVAGVEDGDTLAAALLHDTIEDTDTTPEELRANFGDQVLSLVQECTDDKSLPKEERKRLQIERAPHKSVAAKHIKIADKISNVREIGLRPPVGWSHERQLAYLDWAEKVVAGLRGVNSELEALFDKSLSTAREQVSAQVAQSK